MAFHDEEMTPEEIHGTLLRVATDELVNGVKDLETRATFLERRAQAIADTLAIRNEIRAQIYAED